MESKPFYSLHTTFRTIDSIHKHIAFFSHNG